MAAHIRLPFLKREFMSEPFVCLEGEQSWTWGRGVCIHRGPSLYMSVLRAAVGERYPQDFALIHILGYLVI